MRLAIFFAVVALMVSSAGSPGVIAASAWQTGPSMPTAHSEVGVAVIDGAIYLAGGLGGGDRLDRFDTVSGTWSLAARLPFAVHHPGVTAIGGKVIIAGGYDVDDHMAVAYVWAYDPVAATWSALPDLPRPRGAFGLVAVDDALYAIGGAGEHLGGPVSGETLRLAAGAEAWEPLAPLPTPREHLAVVAANGLIYAIGGRANGDEGDAFAAATERYDPTLDTWEALPGLPVPRGGLAGVAADGAVIVLGGERGDALFADVNRFDIAAGEWGTLPPMPTARHGLAAAFVNDVLYAIAGSTLAGSVENTPIVETLQIESAGTPTA